MICLLMTTAILGADRAPIDAFRANYAALKVDVDYHYRCGFAEAPALARGRLWTTRDLAIQEQPEWALEGRWSCDGVAQSFRYGSPPALAVAARKAFEKEIKIGKVKILYRPSYEGIFDGNVLVGHHFDEPYFATHLLNISPVTLGAAPIASGCGPFSWWPGLPFPWLLHPNFVSATPTRGVSSMRGLPLEVEVYRRNFDGFWLQLEIAYDASVGHLPRYARLVASGGPTASVREYYLIDAMPGAGGFVPAEWYCTAFRVDRFAADYPSYSHATALEPRERSFVGHFKASRIGERAKPVELDRLDEVTAIDAPGGHVDLKHKPRTLTLAEIKALVGPRLMEPAEPGPPASGKAETAKSGREPR